MELSLPWLLGSSAGCAVFFIGSAFAAMSMTRITPFVFPIARLCIVAAAVVPTITVGYLATQFQMPLWSRVAIVVLGLAVITSAGGMLFRLVSENQIAHNETQAEKVVSRATKLLRKIHHLHPLNAMRQAGAANLHSNEEVIEVHNQIIGRNHVAPFSNAIQPKDYLGFLKFSVSENLPLGVGTEIYEATRQFYLLDAPNFITFESRVEYHEAINKFEISIGYRNIGKRNPIDAIKRFWLIDCSLTGDPTEREFHSGVDSHQDREGFANIAFSITKPEIPPQFVVLTISYLVEREQERVKQQFFYKWSGIKSGAYSSALHNISQEDRTKIEQKMFERGT